MFQPLILLRLQYSCGTRYALSTINWVYTPIPALCDRNNQVQTSVDTIVETFADHYYTVTQSDNNQPQDWNPPLADSTKIIQSDIHLPITVATVQISIQSLKNTSPAPGGVHAKLLKHLNLQLLEAITFFFNRIWQERCFPTAWQETHILPICKPDKDATLPASYHPISLTIVLCKAMEKITVKRLHSYLENEKALDPYQCDFCSAISTIDNLLYLNEEIHLGFARQQHITCVFFDVKNSSVRLSPASLIKAM